MHVQYVGIGILVTLKMCIARDRHASILHCPHQPSEMLTIKLLISLYIFNATFCRIHFAQKSGQTRTKWRLSVCTKYGLKVEKMIILIKFMHMCINTNN